MRKATPNPKINKYRVETGAKGYLTRKELPTYAGVGSRLGKRLYEEIEEAIKKSGRHPLSYGLSTKAVNEYLGLDQADIERLAAAGL